MALLSQPKNSIYLKRFGVVTLKTITESLKLKIFRVGKAGLVGDSRAWQRLWLAEIVSLNFVTPAWHGCTNFTLSSAMPTSDNNNYNIHDIIITMPQVHPITRHIAAL